MSNDGFRNSILAGLALVREAIQSPNYVTGVSGWTINQDGSAEFANLTIRSSDGSQTTVTVANGVITIVDGAGRTVVQIDSNGYRLYDTSGNIIAQIIRDTGVSLGGFYCRNFTSGATPPVYAFASGGQLTSGPVTLSQAAVHGFLQYVINTTSLYTVQTLSTGQIDLTLDTQARLQLISQRGQRSVAWIDGGSSSVAADLHATGNVIANGSLSASNVQFGHANTPAPGGTGGTSTVNVTFSAAMPNVPNVSLTITSTVDPGTVTIRAYATNVTTTGFTINCYRSTNSGTGIDWHALCT